MAIETSGATPADSREPAEPVRAGPLPQLADSFRVRTDTGPELLSALGPGQTLVLSSPEGQAAALNGSAGGTGKTQLAAYLAESLWQSRAVDLLVWVVAASRDSIMTSFVQAFASTRGPDPGDDAEAVAARFIDWLATTDRPWLVVLDDLADPADLEGLWPRGPAGRVLITTRDLASVGTARGVRHFPVGAFSAREALNYMMTRLSADPDQRLGVVDLVEDLARLPLALAQASALIATSGQTCRDYCEHFGRRRDQIAATTGVEPSAATVTWTLSLEEADRITPARQAQTLLALSALLDGHGIPGAVLSQAVTSEHGADPMAVQNALMNLERTGLLAVDPASASHTVRMSPTVQTAVLAAMPPAMQDQMARLAARGLLDAWPEPETEPWLALALRSCAASLQRSARDPLWASGSYPVLFRAGRSLGDARLTGPALTYWHDLAVTSDRVLGTGHEHALAAREQLAEACAAAGRRPEAISLYDSIVDARRHALGPDHPDTLAAELSLGRAFMAAGRTADAIALFEKIVGVCDRVQGPDHPATLNAQDGLADACAATGRLSEAIRLYERSLAIRERFHGKQHPDTLTARATLADAYVQAGRQKDALPLLKRTVADRESLLGPDHPDTIAVRADLANAYYTARRVKDALPLYERTLADRERILGPDHPDTIGARGNLASAYHSAGRIASARDMYEQTRADCERILGPDHPDTLVSRTNLAHVYHALGRDKDAITMLRNTLADCKRVLPPGDPLIQAVQESLDAAVNA